jgi:hypothetical protein
MASTCLFCSSLPLRVEDASYMNRLRALYWIHPFFENCWLVMLAGRIGLKPEIGVYE